MRPLWPPLDTIAGARRAVRLAFAAFAVYTLDLVILIVGLAADGAVAAEPGMGPPLGFEMIAPLAIALRLALHAALLIGLWYFSRFAAALATVLGVLLFAIIAVNAWPHVVALEPIAIGGLVLGVVLTLLLVNGVRGAFAYHRFKKGGEGLEDTVFG